MTEPFARILHVGWGDLDSNGHMRNTSYLDMGATVRMLHFREHGFTMRDFQRLRVGPVIMRDEVEYFRELNILDEVRVTLILAGLSEDVSRFRMRNEFFREDGKLVARVTSTGGWMDLTARKLTLPPEELAQAMRDLSRAEDFEVLPSSVS
jgi:acyl-CoA thioester hydrolase